MTLCAAEQVTFGCWLLQECVFVTIDHGFVFRLRQAVTVGFFQPQR